eukprot:GHVO01017864.1.p1 GENE.GHVO01017864.1~~GHVO01017864.1.p1  ORF type:complete len:278 (-),score=39.61 GHVO01017864.1:36-869(-)
MTVSTKEGKNTPGTESASLPKSKATSRDESSQSQQASLKSVSLKSVSKAPPPKSHHTNDSANTKKPSQPTTPQSTASIKSLDPPPDGEGLTAHASTKEVPSNIPEKLRDKIIQLRTKVIDGVKFSPKDDEDLNNLQTEVAQYIRDEGARSIAPTNSWVRVPEAVTEIDINIDSSSQWQTGLASRKEDNRPGPLSSASRKRPIDVCPHLLRSSTGPEPVQSTSTTSMPTYQELEARLAQSPATPDELDRRDEHPPAPKKPSMIDIRHCIKENDPNNCP